MAMTVGNYALGRIIGTGAYARVVEAQHMETGEIVAIKILDRKVIEREKLLEYVKKEIAVLHSLKHPNIVALKDVLLTPTNVFLVQELVAGVELFEFVASRGALDENAARGIFRQLLSAVDYCHTKGICHRDLKLENCLIDAASNTIKIVDFGFSRHLNSTLKSAVGTPAYIAPEALQDQKYDGRSLDVWACGVMLYVMVCGRYPFGEVSSALMAMVNRIRAADYTPCPQHLSPQLQSLVKRIFIADPEQRISMEEMKQHAWLFAS